MEKIPTVMLPYRRVQSVDLLRGIIMIVMAIDHVRVYSGVPAGGPTAAVFFTRWITHYCVPTFAFFAGSSAFLYFQKVGSKQNLINFLLTRGLLLVIFEITICRFLWTFNVDYANYVATNVIWALGWSMILFAAFVQLRPLTVGLIGVGIIFGQQLFQFVPSIFPDSLHEQLTSIWSFFYPSEIMSRSGANIFSGAAGLPKVMGIGILYYIIPINGIMMAGYGFGQLLLREDEAIRRVSYRIGTAAVFLFLIIGSVIILSVPQTQNSVPFIFKLLAQQKYPPSQLYVLMTLGPIILFVPWAEKAKGRLADAVRVIGRVPMFYYLLHILLIHLSAFIVNLLVYGNIHQDWYVTAPFVGISEEVRWSLPLLYAVWGVNIVVLYFACRQYANFKSNHPELRWIKYL